MIDTFLPHFETPSLPVVQTHPLTVTPAIVTQYQSIWLQRLFPELPIDEY